MKKSIIILSGGVVAISLIWLVNETLLIQTNAPNSAERQQGPTVVQQVTTAEQKTKAKPTSKPSVFDFSKKAHWYDPETTIGLYESKTLSEWLKPFRPKPQEFQIIAQYETSYKKLKESLSEDEYYSIEGRKWLLDEILKLNKQLWEQLGEERTRFYAEVRELDTGYYHTWKALTVNGISEDRVSEFRELADEFNREMHGWPLYRAERNVARYATELRSNINFDHQEQTAKSFRDRIEKEFGKQVLDDIIFLRGDMFFMDQLNMGDDPSRYIKLMLDPKHQERLNNLYDVDFDLFNEDDGIIDKQMEEYERLEKREWELSAEWAKHYDSQLLTPEEILIISH